MDSQAATAIAQATNEVTEAARDLKRTNAAARRGARELLQRLDALQQACAAHGIQINVNAPSSNGEHSGRREHTGG